MKLFSNLLTQISNLLIQNTIKILPNRPQILFLDFNIDALWLSLLCSFR